MNLKEQITQQLKIIPQAVINGGLMSSIHWKEKAAKAQKMLKHPNPKRSDLEHMLDQLRQFQ
jgi:hypothetical protein